MDADIRSGTSPRKPPHGSTKSGRRQRISLPRMHLRTSERKLLLLTIDLLIINASIGHDLAALSAQARATCPGVRVVGASCAGVVGREGVSESMNDVCLLYTSPSPRD